MGTIGGEIGRVVKPSSGWLDEGSFKFVSSLGLGLILILGARMFGWEENEMKAKMKN